jgi:hypothetical protein
MLVQIIVYSMATGRIRRVADPEVEVKDNYITQIPIVAGEGRILYKKKGNGQDHLHSWQNTVNQVTGKSITAGVDANDTWYFVDANGYIFHVQYACTACGDPHKDMIAAGVSMAQGPYAVGGMLSGGTVTNGILIGATYTAPHG